MRSSAHSVVTVTTPLSVLPYRPSHCRPTCAVFTPSLRSPESSITSTPPPCGAVARSLSSSSSRRALTVSGSHRDSDRKNCSRCTAGCCAPATGSAPASAVSVLFRSRGASNPARYSRNPRRCAKEPNRSSNRAAYPSSGPRAAGREARAGLGLAVVVPAAVDLDAAPGQAGQDGVPVRLGEGGGQAGGGRAGPDGGDDGPADGGEGDLPGVHRLSGTASPAGG